MKENLQLSTQMKGKKLIQHVKSSKIFTATANYKRNQNSSEDTDCICIIDWKLNSDLKRPNKRSRPIKLIITNEALSDCKNLEKAKDNLMKILESKKRLLAQEHNEIHPTPITWLINTSELNN